MGHGPPAAATGRGTLSFGRVLRARRREGMPRRQGGRDPGKSPDLFGSRQGRDFFYPQDVFPGPTHPPTQPDRVSGYRSDFPSPGG